MKNNQKGRSMIEMLGVLSITGIISMSGISLYSKALYHRKISNTIEQVSELIANMRNTYRNRRDFGDMPEANKDPKNVIPSDMIRGDSIVTALGTPVTLTKGADGKKEFLITLADTNTLKSINKTACLKIVTSDWGKNIFIGLNKSIEEQNGESTIPIMMANKNCSKDANTIYFLVK